MILYLLIFIPYVSSNKLTNKLTTYKESEARTLFNLAAGAYGNIANQQSCMIKAFPHGYKYVKRIEEKCDWLRNRCGIFIIKSDANRQLILSFRGTNRKLQLVLQMTRSLLKKNFFGMGLVNSYYKKAHIATWRRIEGIIRQYKSYSIIFTGHSLGGALASLAAIRTVKLGLRNSNQVKLITFGQPKIGNIEFARSANKFIPNSFRIVHKRDCIPHWPFGKKYVQQMTEIWYPDRMNSSNYKECIGPPMGEDLKCSKQLKLHTICFKDHRVYFEKMVAKYGKSGCRI